eukprot:XP_011672073.1 PREDICTED: proline-rich receptor-like protein kinase PERK12 [Strongylocentrotus purpuratus]
MLSPGGSRRTDGSACVYHGCRTFLPARHVLMGFLRSHDPHILEEVEVHNPVSTEESIPPEQPDTAPPTDVTGGVEQDTPEQPDTAPPTDVTGGVEQDTPEQPDTAPPTDETEGVEQDMDSPPADDAIAGESDFPPPPEDVTSPPEPDPSDEVDHEVNDVTDLIDSAVEPEVDDTVEPTTTENEVNPLDEEIQPTSEVTEQSELDSPELANGESTPPPMYDEAAETEKSSPVYQNGMVADDPDGITSLDDEVVPNGNGMNGDQDPIIMMYSDDKTSSTKARLICFVMCFVVVAVTVIALVFYVVVYLGIGESSDGSGDTMTTTPSIP